MLRSYRLYTVKSSGPDSGRRARQVDARRVDLALTFERQAAQAVDRNLRFLLKPGEARAADGPDGARSSPFSEAPPVSPSSLLSAKP